MRLLTRRFATACCMLALTSIVVVALAAPKAGAPWPVDRKGLVFLWSKGFRKPFSVLRENGKRLIVEYYEPSPRGLAHFEKHVAMRLAGGSYVVNNTFEGNVEKHMTGVLRKAGEMTVEAYIRPERVEQRGECAIMWYGPTNSAAPNWQIAQRGKDLLFETTSGGDRATLQSSKLHSLSAAGPFHLVVTSGPTGTSVYVDGKRTGEFKDHALSAAKWPDGLLVFGNSGKASSPWHGIIAGMALYSRALSPEEAAADANAFMAKIRARKPVPRLRLRGVLLAKAKFPSPQEEMRYNKAFAHYEWRVKKVLEGELEEDKIRVAHWVWLDRRLLAGSALKVGVEKELTIELVDEFGAHQQLIRDEQGYKDGLKENDDLDLYYDAGPIEFLDK